MYILAYLVVILCVFLEALIFRLFDTVWFIFWSQGVLVYVDVPVVLQARLGKWLHRW